jgi:hypothetical protein
MAGKGDTFENELLEHILNNADVATVGDGTGLRGSATPGNLYVALHTDAGPLDAGDQETLEATYGDYARIAIVRTGAAWTVTLNSASPASAITFAEASSGTETITFFSVGVAASGASKILYYGAVSPTIDVTTGVTPELKTTSAITED